MFRPLLPAQQEVLAPPNLPSTAGEAMEEGEGQAEGAEDAGVTVIPKMLVGMAVVSSS